MCIRDRVKTAGGTAVARSVQKRERIHPGHYLGTGKIEELKAMLLAYDATGIVCDDELSPAQLRKMCIRDRIRTAHLRCWQ